jgi:hypothetical protein
VLAGLGRFNRERSVEPLAVTAGGGAGGVSGRLPNS